MKYRYLGNSGLQVSEICFGVMSFTGKAGWTHIARIAQQEANRLVNIALGNGVNFFDTADVYSEGISETMLGRALDKRRHEAVIATKCGFRTHPGPHGEGLSRRHIITACEASLRRLGTDYIDLYQIHTFDFQTPLEETLKAFDQLVKDGKVRYIGCSNFSGWQLMKALAMQASRGWERFISLQAYYSLVGRDLEWELVPVCEDQNLGVLPWSPLHGGFLTGKYRKDSDWPSRTRLKSIDDALPFDREKGFRILEELSQIAARREVSVAQVALNYLLRKKAVCSVIIGARNEDQLRDNIAAANWRLDSDEIESLDCASEPYRPYPHWYFDIFSKDRNSE